MTQTAVERRLLDISVGGNMRGLCSACNKKSYRWAKWIHIEEWYRNHKCVDGMRTSKNGKRDINMSDVYSGTSLRRDV